MDMKILWIENTEGKKDSTLTFAVLALGLVFFKVLFAGNTWGPITINPIDAATIGALLTPTLTAYVARRYTDKKFADANNNGIDDAEEEKKDGNPG